jgi:phospho-N-acetylmuramoyl-pentapeptide-transferase
LPLGGLLGLFKKLLGQTLPLLIVCGVFLAEMFSVVLQIACYRWTGRRIFLCAPLHHHFQFLGWPEQQVVRRFWLAGAVCTLAGLGLLQLTQTALP